LLSDQEGIRQDVNTEETKKLRVRHDLQLSYDLSEELRKYVFKNRTTKTAVIEKALVLFLDREKR